jgi:L-2-hydroxyglutarate oxidase LhgO
MNGRDVWVLEGNSVIGSVTSSRNSEVVHAGIYYPQDSLKARLCVRGKQLLYQYCLDRNVSHRRCGKLLVATSQAQLLDLENIQYRAEANGVDDLVLLSAAEALAMEPSLHSVGAVFSPSTGIIDSHGLIISLQGDLESAGSHLVVNTLVTRVELNPHGRHRIWTNDGTCLLANVLVNSAGLTAPALASCFEGLETVYVPKSYFAKGNYFSLNGKVPFTRLIYPIPELGGLGVHLTLDLVGRAKFGPDVQWISNPNDYSVDPHRMDGFYREIRKYWPSLPDGALQPAYSGIRPKINGEGQDAADFCIQGPEDHGVVGLVNLFGIESPGLTSALALAEVVVKLVNDN